MRFEINGGCVVSGLNVSAAVAGKSPSTRLFKFHYGTPSQLGADFADKAPVIDDIFARQSKLWNQLVDIELNARDQIQSVLRRADAGYAELEDRKHEFECQLEIQKRLPKSERSDEENGRLDRLIAEIKGELWASRRSVLASARPQLDEIDLKRRECVSAAVAEAGLWYHHLKTITKKHYGARGHAWRKGFEWRKWRPGTPGTLKIRWKRGTQLTDLFAGRDRFAGLQIVDRNKRHAELRIGIARHEGRTTFLRVPFVYHQAIPSDAEVFSIAFVPRKERGGVRWRVAIEVELSEPEFRNGADSRLVLGPEYINEDEDYKSAFEHSRHLRHVLDSRADRIWRENRDRWALSDEVSREVSALSSGETVRWSEIVALSQFIPVLKADLAPFQRMAKEMRNVREKAMRRRADRYRKIAAGLCRMHGSIALERPARGKKGERTDRPDWSKFCSVMRQSGRKWGCQIEFIDPGTDHNQEGGGYNSVS